MDVRAAGAVVPYDELRTAAVAPDGDGNDARAAVAYAVGDPFPDGLAQDGLYAVWQLVYPVVVAKADIHEPQFAEFADYAPNFLAQVYVFVELTQAVDAAPQVVHAFLQESFDLVELFFLFLFAFALDRLQIAHVHEHSHERVPQRIVKLLRNAAPLFCEQVLALVEGILDEIGVQHLQPFSFHFVMVDDSDNCEDDRVAGEKVERGGIILHERLVPDKINGAAFRGHEAGEVYGDEGILRLSPFYIIDAAEQEKIVDLYHVDFYRHQGDAECDRRHGKKGVADFHRLYPQSHDVDENQEQNKDKKQKEFRRTLLIVRT